MKGNFQIFGEGGIEASAINQFMVAMKEPFSMQGALMPDAHHGYALPIGGVVATIAAVVPAWVGYDIGCGVLAAKTSFTKSTVKEHAEDILNEIFENVPVGFYSHPQDTVTVQKYQAMLPQVQTSEWLGEYLANNIVATQLGTMGGNNHFIEIGYDIQDNVWIIVHSGSRNLGHKVASHHMRIAADRRKPLEWHWPLSPYVKSGKDYLKDASYCQLYALKNRMCIMRAVEAVLKEISPGGRANLSGIINRNHNHVQYDKDIHMYIHRKGATHAKEGMAGVIPGNSRDGCYIVEGKGNINALFSSSHGAGRAGSRRWARDKFSGKDMEDALTHVTAIKDDTVTEEHPDAYKDIDAVMHHQSDMVEVTDVVFPIISVKAPKKRKGKKS